MGRITSKIYEKNSNILEIFKSRFPDIDMEIISLFCC